MNYTSFIKYWNKYSFEQQIFKNSIIMLNKYDFNVYKIKKSYVLDIYINYIYFSFISYKYLLFKFLYNHFILISNSNFLMFGIYII